MIGNTLVFLKNRLNNHFRTLAGGSLNDAWEDKVVFIDGDQKPDSIAFKLGAVSLVLFHIEQENLLRPADPYVRVSAEGVATKVQPDICLNLCLLFVAKFKDYEQGLHYLSSIIQYFQANKRLDRQNAPELDKSIDHLVVEFTSLSISQQNELWGLLRAGYLPSLTYKVRTVIFRQEGGAPTTAVSEQIRRGLS
ncbi:DUF4255 domain-containing protein [Methylogaea oryzae]|uniref:Pvc16 N-terminal domain-containing protein n=2 Tax=Methylogaea oryzae TaxID=1295382 RepID=A0A8D4VN90_9GAMM|nr:DUF4255 domain-containing protein [Methylogaea oryzae]BBL70716.1 hypothetical protein MoryE10_13220 [Methylogaea oryzae]